MQWKIEKMIKTVMKHLEMNQISILNNPKVYAVKQIIQAFGVSLLHSLLT